MKYECYKLFVKRKAWLVILVFMLLRLVTVSFQQNPSGDFYMAVYRDSYLQHMEVLEGRLTDEKIAYIAEQNQMIAEAKNLIADTAFSQYIDGEITEEQLTEQLLRQKKGNKLSYEFKGINEQYARVRLDPDRVYFLYTLGWTGLLGNEHFDFVLIILLIVLTVPVICNEYASDMYPVLRTTVNGSARLFLCKTAVSILIALLSVMLLFSVEYAYYATVFGLPGGTFPLQTLSSFADSPYQISIGGAAALTFLNRCFGAVFLTVLLLCLSSLLKRAMSAAFLGALCIFMPFLLCSDSEMKYLLPTPLGFLLSCGFLKSRYPVRPNAQDYLTVTSAQYFSTVCLSAVIILILFLVGLFAYCGFKMPCRCRAISHAAVLLILFLLTGCSEQPAVPDLSGVVFDTWSYCPKTKDYSVIDDEQYGKVISFQDRQEQIPLMHDCFADLHYLDSGVKPYIENEKIYYVTNNDSHNCKITALNVRDFSEQVVYDCNSYNMEDRDILFGFGRYIPDSNPEDMMISSFFVHNGLLFMQRRAGIVCYDLNTKTETRLYEGKAQNLAAACGYLYYINDLWDLCRYDMKKNCSEKLPVGKTRRFYAVENGLYSQDVRDNKFYYLSPDGRTKELLTDFNEEAFLKGEIS